MMKSKPVIGMIWCDPFSGNLGVGALAYSALYLIRSILDENGAEARFLLTGPSSLSQRSLTVGGIEIPFESTPRSRFLTWNGLVRRIGRPFAYQTFRLFQSKVIFDLSEGDSFTDLYGEERFEEFLDSKRFFNLLGKVQVMLPQTIGPFNTPGHDTLAFGAMRKMERVMARDNQSFVYASRYLESEKVVESIDLAFALPFEKRSFDDARVHIGVNVSALLWNGGYTRDNQFLLKADYRELMGAVLAYLSSRANGVVHLISHVVPDNMPVENDYTVACELHERFPNFILAPRFNDPIEAKNYISGMDFFVGARMHATIAAFSSGVPVFPIAYSRKFNGLFCGTLGYSWIGDCVNEDQAAILARLEQAYESRTRLKQDIESIDEGVVQPRLRHLQASLSEILHEALGAR